jgi:hypothetical protein
MLYELYETERNGYHDSDFISVCYDSDKDEIRSVEIGSTRYGGCEKHKAQVCHACAGIERDIPAEADVERAAGQMPTDPFAQALVAVG